jgi:predicted GNAT superfamily acetyltransferase
MLRDAAPEDFAAILALNEESLRFLGPLTIDQLAAIHAEAAYRRVFVAREGVVAFLLALREGGAYASLNYRWFADRYERFLYIDRIVVANSYHRRGIGDALYADLFAFARRTTAPCVTCEIDIEPPNEVSRRFHRRHGFEEVGTQSVFGGKKRVSLQLATLTREDLP